MTGSRPVIIKSAHKPPWGLGFVSEMRLSCNGKTLSNDLGLSPKDFMSDIKIKECKLTLA